ncbi:serine/threonine-protein kinase [Anaerolineales bacterium HSG24]|nr:serine/threonine-protein kinase [Anaerolineales bacterium HSG24]
MASKKTECTELSVCFGLLRIDPCGLTPDNITQYFNDTVSMSEYENFKTEFYSNEKLYMKFYDIGINLRTYQPFTSLTSVRWEGKTQQASSISIARDIVAANTSISIKESSNIVYNRSLYGFFKSLPKGEHKPPKSPNWYQELSPNLHQKLYTYARQRYDCNLPELVTEYIKPKVVSKSQKKLFAKKAKEVLENDGEGNCLYLALCHDVAKKSAKIFNDALQENKHRHNTIGEYIIRELFRIGDTEYILCGLDKGKSFAVTIPDMTTWKRGWRFIGITAEPDLESGQSRVNIELMVEDVKKRMSYTLKYHVEIRWSHGKFVSNPEAKIYKDFPWKQVPFFKIVYESSIIQKNRIIGKGGFGIVYEGVYQSKQKVAIKELDLFDRVAGREKRQRFEREISILSELNHTNILSVIDYDMSVTPPWFAMPLADKTLDDIIDDLPNNYERIEKIYLQLLKGINHAHNHNVIHRDIKPANVFLFDNEQVQIGDFGLGKHEDTGLTTSDGFKGTQYYAAPEQFESFREVDHRADIYALGKTLYHMTTGKRPPVFSPPNLSDIDIRYREFVENCTYRNREDRIQSVAEMIGHFLQFSNIAHQRSFGFLLLCGG